MVAIAKIKMVDMIEIINLSLMLFLTGGISLFSNETSNVSLMLSLN